MSQVSTLYSLLLCSSLLFCVHVEHNQLYMAIDLLSLLNFDERILNCPILSFTKVCFNNHGNVGSPSPRTSRSQMFFKIGVLRNFAIFTGKHMCWSLFLIQNITKFFYRTPPVTASVLPLSGQTITHFI